MTEQRRVLALPDGMVILDPVLAVQYNLHFAPDALQHLHPDALNCEECCSTIEAN